MRPDFEKIHPSSFYQYQFSHDESGLTVTFSKEQLADQLHVQDGLQKEGVDLSKSPPFVRLDIAAIVTDGENKRQVDQKVKTGQLFTSEGQLMTLPELDEPFTQPRTTETKPSKWVTQRVLYGPYAI